MAATPHSALGGRPPRLQHRRLQPHGVGRRCGESALDGDHDSVEQALSGPPRRQGIHPLLTPLDGRPELEHSRARVHQIGRPTPQRSQTGHPAKQRFCASTSSIDLRNKPRPPAGTGSDVRVAVLARERPPCSRSRSQRRRILTASE